MKGKKPTLLLVEDDTTLREAVCHQLESEGRYTVFAVGTGEEAVKRIASKGIVDLLITDFDLRGPLDGLDIARAARGVYPKIPIVLITGSDPDLPRIREFLQLPLTTLLGKPFQQAELKQAIFACFDVDHGFDTMSADDSH